MIFLILAVIFFGLALHAFFEKPPAPPPPLTRQTFTVPTFDDGTLTVDVLLPERDLIKAEEHINEFGMQTDQRYLAANCIKGNCFARLRHKIYAGIDHPGLTVISARKILPAVKPQKPSMADSLVQTFKATTEAAEAVAKEAGLDDKEIDLKKKGKAYAKVTIDTLFHGQ